MYMTVFFAKMHWHSNTMISICTMQKEIKKIETETKTSF